MAFTDTQTRSLRSKLKRRHVKTRQSSGSTLHFIEGWHAVAEANRIFGFDSWDRQTLSPQCHWTNLQGGQTVCFYSTKVRITVRAGATVTIREGIGTGVGRAPQAELAHDVALKAAETDATKRALATFGNPFGLALYDREQSQVTKPRVRSGSVKLVHAPLQLTLIKSNGEPTTFDTDDAFIAETLVQIATLASVNATYEFWAANLAAFTELRRRSNDDGSSVVPIVEALKKHVRGFGTTAAASVQSSPPQNSPPPTNGQETTAFLLPKEKRIRDREHLAFVAAQPCLVCGKRPAQAHHLKFAQPRGMAIKVSDEFTVPICNTHHDQLHRSGDERAWWARHGIIDPLKYADRLWAQSHTRQVAGFSSNPKVFDLDAEPEFVEPSLRRHSNPVVTPEKPQGD